MIFGVLLTGDERRDNGCSLVLTLTVHIASGTGESVCRTHITLLVGLRDSVAAVRQRAVDETLRRLVVTVAALHFRAIRSKRDCVRSFVTLLIGGIDDAVVALRLFRELTVIRTIDAEVAVEIGACVTLLAETAFDGLVSAVTLDCFAFCIATGTDVAVLSTLITLLAGLLDTVAARSNDQLTRCSTVLSGQTVQAAMITLLASLNDCITAIRVRDAGIVDGIRTVRTVRRI